MKSIHRKSIVLFVSIVAIVLMFPQAIAKPSAKKQKHDAATKRREPPKSKSIHNARQRERAAAKTNRNAQRRLQAQRRAEAARQAQIARQRAREDAMRNRVQEMIARDDVTGEDPEIRRIAISALGNHAGTVVVMDPQTGRVYSIVNQQWAVREGFKPCSTIKLVTGLAGLDDGVIDPANTTAISNSNRVNLTQALAFSKNDYFQQVGVQVGFDKMISYARQVGLGAKTGINLRSEAAGSLPSLRAGFSINRMSSHGDGFKVTALQLATLASVFANRGKLVVPFVVRSSSNPNSSIHRQMKIDSATWQSMVPGMVGAVQYGSGRKAHDPMATVAGKTGTCIENGDWVGLFASYAPLNNPKLAIVVIARGSDGRNHFPAAVAGRIYRELSGRFAEFGDTQIAATPNRPVNQIEVASETETNEEEADEISNGDSANTSEPRPVNGPKGTIWGTERISPDRKVKTVIMPAGRPRRSTQQ